jgi:tRNA1Val (adenine37-N6)-methyltransferase
MGEELCFMVGNWRIFQRYGGHRYSTDDVVTAWVAAKSAKGSGMIESSSDGPAHCLDLGCGIGSVLMMVAWQFPNATCLGVEAQTLSASMARRSLQYNGAEERVKVIQKDLRDLDVSLREPVCFWCAFCFGFFC